MRADEFSRRLMRESVLRVDDLIQPLFVHEGKEEEAVEAMPGVVRHGVRGKGLRERVRRLAGLGIPAVVLFPVVAGGAKSAGAEEAWREDGLVQRAVREIKEAAPGLGVITDVALDPYTVDGQDGLTDGRGYVENDRTVAALVKQAISHARAGADVVAPSDMMDGRVGALRGALEGEGFVNTRILAYSAKTASVFYAPFREAVDSAGSLGGGDKFGYQLDVANGDEAVRETALDIEEGADMVMVKPGVLNLDLVWRVKEAFGMPTFAYQVSGEYAMLKAAAGAGWLDERAAVLEVLSCFKRAGCDGVLSYYAEEVGGWVG